MKVTIRGGKCTVTRTRGDKKYPETMGGESTLLYHVKQYLNKRGYDLIKKRMWKDGHMFDERQQYLRARTWNVPKSKNIAIFDGEWNIRNSAKEFNDTGKVTFLVIRDMMSKEPRR